MKTPKNTQNADMPTKDTRQCNNTPKPLKRHIRKIFAFVACLLLMVNIAIPCFASGWQGETSNVTTMHPYAPDSITFDTPYYDANFTLSTTFPAGDTNTQNGNTTTMYINGNSVPLSQITEIDTENYHLRNTINNNTTIFPQGTINTIRIHWSSFVHVENDELFAEYFDDELVALNYNVATYYKGTFTAVYTDPTSLETDTVTETFTVTNPTSRWSLSYLARSFMDTFLPQTDVIVDELTATITPYTSIDGNPSANTRLISVQVYAPYITDDTNPRTLAAFFRVSVIPENADGSALFGWLGDTISGVLETPLIPISDNFTISLGTMVSLVVGLSLLFAFMKLFSGG